MHLDWNACSENVTTISYMLPSILTALVRVGCDFKKR